MTNRKRQDRGEIRFGASRRMGRPLLPCRLFWLGVALLAAASGSASATTGFYTVPPCRVADTRNPFGPYGAPSLAAGAIRTYNVAGQCGLPPTAAAVSINIVVTGATAPGHLRVYPGGTAVPLVSSINYAAGATRANNMVVGLGAGGTMAVYSGQATGTTDFIFDINGYFDDPANNQPPTVNAGPVQNIFFPTVANLAGTATDDGKPSASLTITWAKVSGPGSVVFGNPSLPATTATFGSIGLYVLRLTATDSQLSASSDVTITVNPPGSISRFLQQSSFGPTDPLAAHVASVGVIGYLEEQLNAPASSYPTLAQVPGTVPATCNATCQRDSYSMYPLQNRFFQNALYGDDQLRQRVSWALHRLLVVSGQDVTIPARLTPYLQILDNNAFGNYRQLLYEITLNPAMGVYLDMASSTRTNPNENYAREILQLFSVGVVLLNQDGTPQLDAFGEPLPTYDQSVVTGFAKVFTGWTFAAPPSPGVTNYASPMQIIPSNHDTGTKDLLSGVTLPAGQTAVQDLNAAIDNIFFHPNVGPFISAYLIRQLVTSNPSPAYVGRIAAVFNNNGSGIRGDLRSVVRAILLDDEARRDIPVDPVYGKLMEPVLLATNLLRAFNAHSANGSTFSDGVINPQTANMGEDVFRPNTVFSYYPADYLVPGSTTVLGPEFGILSATTALRRANFVNTMVFSNLPAGGNQPLGTSLDLTNLAAHSADPTLLVLECSRVLMNGMMSASMQNSIVQAVNAIPATNPLLRARQALYLVATSSQFQVER
jgi:uncharacterized protein (DUF1800 family)